MMQCISWEDVWVAITALATGGLFIATIFLVRYGRKQLIILNDTNKENFLHQLKDDFFTPSARELLMTIEYNLLSFTLIGLDKDAEEVAFFEIADISNKKIKEAFKNILTDRKYISSYEMDDFLLQHLEDLGLLYRKEIVDIFDIEQLFGYYITVVFENIEIKKYIEWARLHDIDIYSNFESLYYLLRDYREKKGISNSAKKAIENQ